MTQRREAAQPDSLGQVDGLVQVGESLFLVVEQHEQPTDVEQGVGTLLALVVVLGELESTYGGDPGGRSVFGQPLLT